MNQVNMTALTTRLPVTQGLFQKLANGVVGPLVKFQGAIVQARGPKGVNLLRLRSILVDVVRLPHKQRKITRKQFNQDAEEDRNKQRKARQTRLNAIGDSLPRSRFQGSRMRGRLHWRQMRKFCAQINRIAHLPQSRTLEYILVTQWFEKSTGVRNVMGLLHVQSNL